jgi:DNA-binding transcriptional MerR regulator
MIPFTELDERLKPINSPKAVSDLTGIPIGTLGYWRSAGIGPKYSKVGKMILYAKEDVLNYLKSHRQQSTTDVKKAPAATGAQ